MPKTRTAFERVDKKTRRAIEAYYAVLESFKIRGALAAAKDRQINQLLYELHGLTDDEIRIVEEATP